MVAAVTADKVESANLALSWSANTNVLDENRRRECRDRVQAALMSMVVRQGKKKGSGTAGEATGGRTQGTFYMVDVYMPRMPRSSRAPSFLMPIDSRE